MEKQLSVKKAALINGIGKYSKIAFSILVGAILARILSPEDYGIVAVITVFSTFFTTFSDMGFGSAIIQNKQLTQDDIDNIFSFTVYISIGLMLVFGICSFPIASFYGNSVYVPLGQLLSIALLFNALNMVPNGILNRDKKFVSIALRTVVVYISASIIAIILALFGFRYYALVVQSILTAFFQFVWNYATTRPKFRWKFRLQSIRKVLNYSAYQFAFNLVNYFSRNLDNLLTGKLMGSAELGYYNKAYTLMLYPVNNLTGVVSPVLHPILSEYQEKKQIIYMKYLKIVKLLACIGIYVAPVCYLGSEEIISILYGNNWSQSVVCFQLLSIAILPQMINSSAGSIFQALGNTRLLFANSCINTIITVFAILCGVFIGGNIETLSACVAIAYVFHFCTAFYMLIKMGFKYKIRFFIKDIAPELLILVIMIVSVFLYPFSIQNTFLSILVKCLWLGVFLAFGIFVSKDYKLFVNLVKK